MNRTVNTEHVPGGRLRIPRSRGAASGFLLVVLGTWGALVPFVGPAFDFAYDPEQGSAWSAARGWLEVLPGVVAVIGGLVLLRSGNRATAMLGGWLSVIAGAWFVVGRVVATTLTIGEIGAPVAQTDTKAAWLELTYFYGLGAVMVYLGATAVGRLSVRSERDIDYAQKAALERHDTRVENETTDVAAPITGSAPLPPLEHSGAARSRRSWRNPLGRDRTTTSTTARR